MVLDGFVVVAGIPGSGKTTLARPLARELELPLLSKDTIKEALFDGLSSGDLDWSRRLGESAHRVMYAVAGESPGAVLESHFWRGVAEPQPLDLDCALIEIDTSQPVSGEAITDLACRIRSMWPQ